MDCSIFCTYLNVYNSLGLLWLLSGLEVVAAAVITTGQILHLQRYGKFSKCKSTCCLLGCQNESETFFCFVRCSCEWRFVQHDQIHLGFPLVSMPDVAKRGGV